MPARATAPAPTSRHASTALTWVRLRSFFFHAEDGIRDIGVTGVQTCALPIYPARTASTAAALMIGLALVTLVGVLAAGLKSHFSDSVNQAFVANYAVTSTNNFTPIGVASEAPLRQVPGGLVVTGVRAGDGRAFGSRINVTGVSPDASKVIYIKWTKGSQNTPAQLGADGAFVSKDYAIAHHLNVGSPIVVETPRGAKLHLVL